MKPLNLISRGQGGETLLTLYTDTLWASSYGLYEKLPEPAKLLLENLTATHSQPVLKAIAEAKKNEVFEGPRGSPNNVGTTMEAVHPLVRTHPITGWRSVFAPGTDILHDGGKDEIGLTLNRVVINEVTANTSQLILNRLMSIMTEDHDIQVRFKWKSPSDIGAFFLAFKILVLRTSNFLVDR